MPSTPPRAACCLMLATLIASAGWSQAADLQAVLPANPDQLEPAVAELINSAAQRVEAEPMQAEAHGRRGMAYEANSLWPDAESSYERAVELDGQDYRWRYRLAVASRQNGHLERSLELLQQLATEQPDLAPVHQRLALALLEQGDLAGARIQFERLMELEPRFPQGYTGLANVHLLEGDAEGAVSLLESALKLRPEDRQSHYLLGLSYRALGRQEEAKRELARGLNATPAYLPVALDFEIERLGVNLTARLDRASTYLGLGRAEEAVSELEITLEDHPDNLQVMNNLSIAYLRLDRADEVARAPEVSKTHLARAGVLGAMGRFEEARVSLGLVIDLEPDNLRAHLMLGRVLELVSQPEAAAIRYATALELAPDDLGAWLGLARNRLELGEVSAARQALTRARELAPEHPQVIELGRRMASEGDR